MNKTSLQHTFDEFEEFLGWYIGFVATIISAQRVVRWKRQKTELLEAFVIRLVSLWDTYTEDLLIDCLNRDCNQYFTYMKLKPVKHLPRDVCRAMLTGLGYFDCKGPGELRSIGRKILVPQYNPFQAMPKPANTRIDELIHMRNYLTHYSIPAKRALMADYERNHKLAKFREPGEFLWANNRKTGKIRFADYVEALQEAWQAMRKYLGV